MGQILQAVDRLYAAVTTGAWSPALEAVTDVLQGDHAFLHAGGMDGGAGGFLTSARVSESDMARLLSPEAIRLDEPVQRALPSGIFDRRSLVPDAVFLRSLYYNELIRPLDGFHSLAAKQEHSRHGFVLAVCRGLRRPAFDPTDLVQLTCLTPHVATALELHHRMQAAEHACSGLAGMLDRLRTGAILTDASSYPSFINARACQVLAEADGLLLQTGGLAAAVPAVTRRLRVAIAAAAGRTGGQSRKLHHAGSLAAEDMQRLRLARPSQRPPLLLTVLPIGRLGMTVPGVRPPQVAVFITEPDSTPEIDTRGLAEAFHLTRRESATVVLLAGGRSLEQIAAALDISVSSVRQYLKRAFDKTGTHSQAALVALARGFVEP